MKQYEKEMRKCLELARRAIGKTSPNPMVGCVVLDKNGNEIATGYHRKYGENHAERDALLKLNDEARGGTLIVNLEPCSHWGKTPPCADLIVEKGLAKVVIAMRDVNPIVSGNGVKILQKNGIEVVEGVLEDEAKKLNEIFIKNMLEKKCFVAIKTACTIDGKIACHNGESKWITSSEARDEVKNIRNVYDAVLTSSSTVLADNPKFECDKKILIDRNLKCDFSMQYFNFGEIYVVTDENNDVPKVNENIKFLKCPVVNNKIDLTAMFEKLYSLGLRSILIESGGKLNGSMIDGGFVDKIYQFIAPKILGDNSGKSCFDGRNVDLIKNCIQYKIDKVQYFGNDILIEYLKF